MSERHIVKQCEECGRIALQDTITPGIVERVCVSCYVPAAKWRNGICNLATHVRKPMRGEVKEERRLNPLKASKRSMGK